MHNSKSNTIGFIATISLIIGSAVGSSDGAQWEWQEPHAEITPTGDLKWKPEPFAYNPGNSIRYIDFENGSDNNTGSAKNQAWKHHPWDSEATGNAKAASGIHTYVFKRGVIYRGKLIADDSGEKNNPIRLTSDPNWGTGDALLYGSEKVEGTWQQGGHAKMPDGSKIWHIDLPYAPRRLWMVEGDQITRLNLARTPNWTISDSNRVRSEWWTWEGAGATTMDGKKVVRARDTKNLTQPAEYYVDAIAYNEGKPIGSLPTPTRVIAFDPATKMMIFNDPFSSWPSVNVRADCDYYLEDKPHYLDSPGEFWFDKTGEGGRLYVRLPADRNPNQVHLEAAKRLTLVLLDNAGNIDISGLTFRFTNLYWKLDEGSGVDAVHSAVILQHAGQSPNISVHHCTFEHVNAALRFLNYSGQDNDNVSVHDNVIAYTDHYPVWVEGRDAIDFLRNKITEVNISPYAGDLGYGGANLFSTSIIHAAGNFIHRAYSTGLFVRAESGPLNRVFVHHNKVTSSMLNARDWGSIAVWNGGPHYIYSNIVGNAGPNQHWAPAYYFDGDPKKKFFFNNVAWGAVENGNYLTNCALQDIWGYLNVIFNNTFYRHEKASNRQHESPQRNLYIGNLFLDIKEWGFYHTRVKGYSDPNPLHVGVVDSFFNYQTVAYADNIFFKPPEKLATFNSKGDYYTTMEAFNAALKHYKTLNFDAGEIVQSDPVKDAENHDFHLADEGSAINKGAKVFVSFPLKTVIGEYNFHRNNTDPTTIIDDHWYKATYYPDRTGQEFMPRFTLKGENITAGSYVNGELEDWTTGALQFNGTNQYAHLSHAEMKKDYTYKYGNNHEKIGKVYGRYVVCSDMEKNNFLLEVYFKTTPGHTTGIIVGKSSTEGYVLDVDPHGKARLRLRSGGADVAKRSSAAAINDGTWHHVIAEVDRSVPQGIRLYVDGKLSNGAFEGTMPNGSLSNTGDLVVGGDPKSNAYLSGTIDFLRISRGTLADAKTTIEELYDWQFVNGPQHFDFEGTEIKDNKRDAGAFEGAPSGISVNRSSETVSKAAYNVVTTLKAAAEKGMHNGMITLSENDSVMEATKDFGSAEILFGSDAISVTDTLVVQENGTYEFAVTTDDAVSFTLTKGAETNSVVANTSANVFRISLVSHTTYVYTIEKQQSSKASECMLTWQKVDK